MYSFVMKPSGHLLTLPQGPIFVYHKSFNIQTEINQYIMDISDCTQIHIDMELNYKFTIKLIKSKLNPCDVGYGESFFKPGNGNMGKP